MLDLGTHPKSAPKPGPAGASIESPAATGSWFAAALIVVVGLATATVFFLDRAAAGQVTRAKEHLDQLHAKLAAGNLADTAAKARALSAAGDRLVTSSQRAAVWSALLKDFQVTTTPGVTLKTLSVDDKNNLKLDGETQSFDQLANYLGTLRASTYASAVDLISSGTAVSAAGPSTVQFSIVVTVKAGALRGQTPSQGAAGLEGPLSRRAA